MNSGCRYLGQERRHAQKEFGHLEDDSVESRELSR
jgi:hypothetical protein